MVIFIISAFIPMNCDEGVWHYAGRVWAQNGIPPYVSAVENKTPGIFELYAISYKFFGLNLIFVRLLAMVALAVSALIVYKITDIIFNEEAAVFAMYIFGLTNTWGMFSGGFVAHTETFMLFFSTLSFWILIRFDQSNIKFHSVLLAGISMGIAIAFKQIAVTTAFAAFLFCVLHLGNRTVSRSVVVAFVFIVGIFAGTFISIFPVLQSGGSFKDYIDGAWLILLNSGSSAVLSVRLSGFLSIFIFSRIVSLFVFILLIFRYKFLLHNSFFVALLIWFLIDFVGVIASGNYYGHQIKQMMPSLSIIIGVLLSELLRTVRTYKFNKKYSQLAMILVVIMLFFPYGGLVRGMNFFLNRNKIDDDQKLGIWLKNNSTHCETVYILGDYYSNVLAYSERFSASKYVNAIFLTTQKERNILFEDLKKNRPVYIVNCKYDRITSQMIGLNTANFIRKNYVVREKKVEYDILINKDFIAPPKYKVER